MTKKGQLIKRTVQRFVEDTTAGGFVMIRDNRGTRRCIWVVVLLLFWSSLAAQICQILLGYFAFDVSTKMQMVSAASVSFPAVTLCNHNPIRASQTNWLIGEVAQDNQLLSSLFVPQVQTVNLTASQEPQGAHLNELAALLFGYPKEAALAGHLYNETVLICYYQGWDCSYSNVSITQWSHGSYGNCYTLVINTTEDSEAAETTATGPHYGLSVSLHTQLAEYIPSISPIVGFRFEVHPKEQAPFPEDNGFTVSGGTLTSVALRKTEIQRQPYPYSYCITPEKERHHTNLNLYAALDTLNDSSSRTFSNKACTKSCLQRVYVEECDCVIAETMNRDLAVKAFGENIKPCKWSNADAAACRQRNMQNRSIIMKCIEQCTQPCHEVQYQIRTDVSSFPSQKFSSYYWEYYNNQFKFLMEDMAGDPAIKEVMSELGFSEDESLQKLKTVFTMDAGVLQSTEKLGTGADAVERSSATVVEIQKQRMLKDMSREFAENNLLRVEIYFEDLNVYTIKETEQVTFCAAVSNIGGLLGLFAGMSFLTVVEMCFFCKHIIGIMLFNQEYTSPLRQVDEDDTKVKREFSYIRRPSGWHSAPEGVPSDRQNGSNDSTPRRMVAWEANRIYQESIFA